MRLGARGSLLGCFAVSTALAFYQEQYLTAYCLLFQKQLPTRTLVWLFGRAAPRNQPYEGIYERNSLREGGLDPQWMLLGTVGQEWKKAAATNLALSLWRQSKKRDPVILVCSR